jgi:hypothetical protein
MGQCKDTRQAKLQARLRSLRSRSVSSQLGEKDKSFQSYSIELPDASMWMDEEGVHAIFPGEPPDAQTLERMTEQFQQKLRESPLFDGLVKKYGRFRAEELLKECRAKLP